MSATPTKAALFAAYVARLEGSGMAWTADPAKMDKAKEQIRRCFNGSKEIDITGRFFVAALAEVGLPKRITYKALHALAGDA